jgi:hypothetical protein
VTGVLAAVIAAIAALLLLLGLMVPVVYLLRHRLRGWAQQSLAQIAGPAIIRSLPPRTALQAILAPLYGETGARDVLVGVLGGAGRDPDGGDTAISRTADVYFRLQSIDDDTCRSESSWTYEFSGVRNSHLLVMFGTHDRAIAAAVTSERIYPLYELWVLNSEDELEDFVGTLRATVELGISYLDQHGTMHTVPPRAQQGEEVVLRQYQKFVRLPDEMNQGDLRIVQFDLYDLADPDHVVESVESLTLKASNNSTNRGHFIWSVPFPCFVRDVVFDVKGLPRDTETLAYMVVTSAAGWYRLALRREWMIIEDTFRLTLNAWLLSGHSVTLLWRPVSPEESEHAPRFR